MPLYVKRPKRSTQLEQQIWAKIYEFIESKISRKTGTSNTNVIDNYTSAEDLAWDWHS